MSELGTEGSDEFMTKNSHIPFPVTESVQKASCGQAKEERRAVVDSPHKGAQRKIET
jgi:hypothetical protein